MDHPDFIVCIFMEKSGRVTYAKPYHTFSQSLILTQLVKPRTIYLHVGIESQ